MMIFNKSNIQIFEALQNFNNLKSIPGNALEYKQILILLDTSIN